MWFGPAGIVAGSLIGAVGGGIAGFFGGNLVGKVGSLAVPAKQYWIPTSKDFQYNPKKGHKIVSKPEFKNQGSGNIDLFSWDERSFTVKITANQGTFVTTITSKEEWFENKLMGARIYKNKLSHYEQELTNEIGKLADQDESGSFNSVRYLRERRGDKKKAQEQVASCHL